MLNEQVADIRALLFTDKETKDAFAKIPTHKDISTAVANSLCNYQGGISPSRKRSRLGLVISNDRQVVIGYACISLVLNAVPTKHEHERVWGSIRYGKVSGIFIRHIIVHREHRSNGYGSMLLSALLVQARGIGLSVYCDVAGGNMRMRKFLHAEWGSPSIFWHTGEGALMVRYRFH